jgi:hypothetical protein
VTFCRRTTQNYGFYLLQSQLWKGTAPQNLKQGET